jgi:sensor histidine kinase regulating citrate/malate metabolism
VTDAGDGIPDHESDVVSGTVGITPLVHASGMELWLARSAVEANGGQFQFEAGAEGTVVTLSHRRAASR